MQIKTVDAFVVKIPFDDGMPFTGAVGPGRAEDPADYPPRWRMRAVYTDLIEAVIVRIETTNGITGWGECHTPVAGEISKAVIDSVLAPIVIGQDPRDIHPLWEKMYASMRVRGQLGGYHLEAMSGIDIALWDIVGKVANAPVCKLLGGQIRDRVPVYASCLPLATDEAGVRAVTERARALVDMGYKALKVRLGADMTGDEAVLDSLRAALGPSVGIAAYVNGAYDLAMARRAGRMMQAYNVLWLEDPLTPENLRDYARLAAFLDANVAGGGSLNTRWQFNDFLAAGAYDVVQPDVSRAGGIGECRRISTLADVYGIPFAPHVSRGTGIYMAATLQWAAAGANLMSCEWPLDQSQAGDGILRQGFVFENGTVRVPDGPGLGIEIDEDALSQWNP